METEPTKPPILPPPPSPAKPATNQAPPDAGTSPWETYLTGKKTPASRLLAKMEAARAKGGLILPDDATRSRFAEALAAKPDRVARLVALLQACGPCSDTVRRIVMALAEAGIKRLGSLTFPEPLDSAGFTGAIAAWLGGPRKKPIKPAELNLLFLFLHYGWQRQLLDHDTAFSLVASAVAKPAKAPPKKAPPAKPAPTPLEILLSSTPDLPVLIPTGTSLPLDGKAIQHRMDVYCVDPSDGYAKLLFACPKWPGRESHGDARLPYTHLTLPVDSHSPPLFERLKVEVTIDHDLIAEVRALSPMRKQSRQARIHDLEFGLSVSRAGSSAQPIRE